MDFYLETRCVLETSFCLFFLTRLASRYAIVCSLEDLSNLGIGMSRLEVAKELFLGIVHLSTHQKLGKAGKRVVHQGLKALRGQAVAGDVELTKVGALREGGEESGKPSIADAALLNVELLYEVIFGGVE